MIQIEVVLNLFWGYISFFKESDGKYQLAPLQTCAHMHTCEHTQFGVQFQRVLKHSDLISRPAWGLWT